MDTSASNTSGPLRVSLRQSLDSLLTVLRSPSWDAECITLELARLRSLLDQRLAQQAERYANALAEAPWIAAEVRDLCAQGSQLREALAHLQTRWVQRGRDQDPDWQRAINDFALQVVEHEAQEWQLREEVFPQLRGEPM